MMDFFAKFIGPEHLVMDFCRATMAVPKEYLLLSECQCFLRCEKNEVFVKRSLISLG